MNNAPATSEPTTRERILRAADDLFYRQGFEHTSFADIADAVQISRGNFYHHFKTKDDILGAVLELRLRGTREMVADWERCEKTPRDRIAAFITILIRHKPLIVQYGCPVGTLCTELAKLNHSALPQANELFTLFRTWLSRQFKALGHDPDADRFAMQLLARTQGAATLAQAFHDEHFLRQEAEEMVSWLDELLASSSRRRLQGPRSRAKGNGVTKDGVPSPGRRRARSP